MNKYYSNFFINGTFDAIGIWLNSFEDLRDNRRLCEYNQEIHYTLVTSEGILIIVKIWEYNKDEETIPS